HSFPTRRSSDLSALGEPSVSAKTSARTPRLRMVPSSARLRQHVDQCGVTALDDGDRAANCRCKIFRIADRSLGMQAHPLRELGIINRGVDEHAADAGIGDATI